MTSPSGIARSSLALRKRRRATTRSPDDVAAFAAVYERHHQALYRYCRSILHHDHDAQDALQSTMARAFAALQNESRNIDMRPWLFRIAHNEAISLLRRRAPIDVLDDLETRDAPVEEQVSLRADLRHLHQDLDALPERQRAALVLRELNGLSHAEIAQVLDCRPAAVKQSIFEARTGLMHAREGRELACDTVRRSLSDGDGRVLRGARLRAHLRSCSDCRKFQQELLRRPRELALLAPPLPVAAGAALLGQLLPASGAATAGMLTTSSAVGTIAALTPKAVATVAVIVTAAGGTAALRHRPAPPAPERPPVARSAAKATPVRTAAPTNVATTARSGPQAREHDSPGKGSHGAAVRRTHKRSKPAHGSSRKAGKARARARGRAARPHRKPVPKHAFGRARTTGPPAVGRSKPKPHPQAAKGHGRRR
jgi:RNA polymerase sigma factor (sigma-70 family)